MTKVEKETVGRASLSNIKQILSPYSISMTFLGYDVDSPSIDQAVYENPESHIFKINANFSQVISSRTFNIKENPANNNISQSSLLNSKSIGNTIPGDIKTTPGDQTNMSKKVILIKNCIQNDITLSKYDEVLRVMKDQYYQQYSHLSTSVNIKLLDNLWKDFFTKNQDNKDELLCFSVSKMLQKDDFAFSIYKELHPDFITFGEALKDNTMYTYLYEAGLTDGNLAYLNALQYLGNLTSSEE